MIKFLLVLYFGADEVENHLLEDKEREAIKDCFIEKLVEMPVIPRIGEYINLGGNNFQVDDVLHVITKGLVEVECNTELFCGVAAYAEDKEGWNLDNLLSDGKELFFKRVEQFEKRKAQREADKCATAQQ